MSTTASAWMTELTTYYTPTASQFDGAKSHKDSAPQGFAVAGSMFPARLGIAEAEGDGFFINEPSAFSD